jgi:hypothetical protein
VTVQANPARVSAINQCLSMFPPKLIRVTCMNQIMNREL